MGVTGFASAAYLGAQLLAYQSGAEVLPVNYAANFSADLMSNVVQLSMSPAAQVPALLAGGKGRERLANLSAVAIGSNAQEPATHVRNETRMWGDVVKARKITPAQ